MRPHERSWGCCVLAVCDLAGHYRGGLCSAHSRVMETGEVVQPLKREVSIRFEIPLLSIPTHNSIPDALHWLQVVVGTRYHYMADVGWGSRVQQVKDI